MGFFKKLKDRLFTLDINSDSQNQEKAPQKKIEKRGQVSGISKNDKKVEKEKLKNRKRKKTLNKYIAGLDKSGSSFSRRIMEMKAKHNDINDDFFDELEEVLIMSDISVELVIDIIDEIKNEVRIENIQDMNLISEIIADKMFVVYANQSIVDTTLNFENSRLNVFIMVGVNGAGKTTSIAKIANSYKEKGKKILVAAADTFRAGAVEQLSVWTERIGVDIVKPFRSGADPASVVFDAVKKAKNEKYDLLILDTAGRLQNKVNLMNELKKMNKIISSEIPGAPHESLLVLDATTGQNGVLQATSFKEVTPLTGIVLTKMDGTSKGGIVLTIKDKLDLSVKLIGLGEKLDDLEEFDLDAFIYGMMKGLIDESR